MVYCDLIARESSIMWTPPKAIDRYYVAHPLLVQVDFEVFGGVHGVYFTKYARDMTSVLGIRGWIRLTRWGTVFGQIQGEKDKIDEMALWLRLQGSPGARIERTEFKNWQIVDGFTYRNFTVRF